MKRFFPILLLSLAAIFLAGCGPTVTALNQTAFPVRVIVNADGRRFVLSPSPGESSTVDVAIGSWKAVVVPDAEWRSYAQLTRKVLMEQIKDSEKLTGPQLLDLVKRMKEVAGRMAQYEKAAAGSPASCGGRITQDNSDYAATVTISTAADGSLIASCK